MLIISPPKETMEKGRDHWNELVAFRDNCNQPELSSYADMLIRGLNTAGGMRLQGEIEIFLDSYPTQAMA